ncbi:MAG: sigma-54 dependent transcriptional regulator [Spirochaetales bacterium]|nr:sigma-54 dependent transcriptional regulator [Spirochaetales bacterium]
MDKFDSCLIVEDDFIMVNLYKVILKSAGIDNYRFCESIHNSKTLVNQGLFGTVILDINLPDGSGLDYLAWHKENHPHIPVIIVTSDSSDETEQSCANMGAFDFFIKPFNKARLLTSLRNALEHYRMKQEIAGFSDIIMARDVNENNAFHSIITRSPHMSRIFKYIEALSPSNEAILIQGESGTGKELISQAVHKSSHRSGKLVSVNVSGLDDTMFSDALFGHEKGAYTGATTERKGLVLEAAEGTLFLDEIGDLETKSQVKLLRLLQEKEYYPLGADQPKLSKARIITATNVDLEQKVNEGTFRKDLYYRLRPHRVIIPPLRERKGDILLLFNHFVKKKSKEVNQNEPIFSNEIHETLLSYNYPGNVRELMGLASDLVFRSILGPVSKEDLLQLLNSDLQADPIEKKEVSLSLPEQIDFMHIMDIYGRIPSLDEVENMYISEALKYHGGNQNKAAQMLGISQSKVSRWLKARGESE